MTRHHHSHMFRLERDGGPLTATLFLVVRRHFWKGTANLARLAITGLDWVKVNGEICRDPRREIREGDTVSFLTFVKGRIDFESKKMTGALLEECY